MNKSWLMVDGNNLAWRAFHSIPRGLGFEGKPTAVTFGFLRDLASFQDRFAPDGVVIAFDSDTSLRLAQLETYKGKRKPQTPQQHHDRAEVSRQIRQLRDRILPRLGYKNVLIQDGYEADDMVAIACKEVKGDDVVIISNDRDLLQLVSGTVNIWNFRKRITLQAFHAEFNIRPAEWAEVKAMAGCLTDCIPGIEGVGEKSALDWMRETLDKGSRFYKRIEENQDVVARFLPLTSLPYPGAKCPSLHLDWPDPKEWKRVCAEFGMESLRMSCPIRATKLPF